MHIDLYWMVLSDIFALVWRVLIAVALSKENKNVEKVEDDELLILQITQALRK